MRTSAGQAMPKYKSHTEVHALPIKAIEPIKGKRGRSQITFQNNFYVPVEIATPKGKFGDGDYYVVQPDGTEAIAAKKNFEAAWLPV